MVKFTVIMTIFNSMLTKSSAHTGHAHDHDTPTHNTLSLSEIFGKGYQNNRYRNNNQNKNAGIHDNMHDLQPESRINDTISIIESLQGLPEDDILEELFNFSENGFLRSISQLGNPYTGYNNYGCWCYFDSHKDAKGATVDTYDDYCRTLHLGYECLLVDHAADNDEFATLGRVLKVKN